jgi:hypothetical protein
MAEPSKSAHPGHVCTAGKGDASIHRWRYSDLILNNNHLNGKKRQNLNLLAAQGAAIVLPWPEYGNIISRLGR